LFKYGFLSFVTGAESIELTIVSSASPFENLTGFVWCGITTSAYVGLVVCAIEVYAEIRIQIEAIFGRV
jgi:hypothetical protein